MTTGKTLLAHLTPRLTERVEDIAVEALGFILSQSRASMLVLNQTLQVVVPDLAPISSVTTQVTGDDGSRPDLVGHDEPGNERVLIEAKFWAGLTDNQPNAYLDRLSRNEPSALVFVAPDARIESLWTELLRRIEEAGDKRLPERATAGMRSCGLSGTGRVLVLASWSFLLNRMAAQLSEDSDASTLEDIHQLQGLVRRQDEQAFLPLRSEELGPDIPRRLLNFRRVVDDVVERGRQEGWADIEGGRVAPQVAGYGRYVYLFGTYSWLGVDYDLWAESRDTPLWVWFDDGLASLDPADVHRKPYGDKFVPLNIPTGVELDEVVRGVASQLREIGQTINPDLVVEP